MKTLPSRSKTVLGRMRLHSGQMLCVRRMNWPICFCGGCSSTGNSISRGLIIRAPGSEEAFSALHPRMTMTNIFKIYEKMVVQDLRDRRATVDRMVNLLTPIFDERKN